MTITIRMSSSWHYKGARRGHRTEKTFDSVDQARRYVRKVTQSAREQKRTERRNLRNTGSMVNFISVWPEGTKEGDIVDVWNHERGWHKGEIYLASRYMSSPVLKARSLPEDTSGK